MGIMIRITVNPRGKHNSLKSVLIDAFNASSIHIRIDKVLSKSIEV